MTPYENAMNAVGYEGGGDMYASMNWNSPTPAESIAADAKAREIASGKYAQSDYEAYMQAWNDYQAGRPNPNIYYPTNTPGSGVTGSTGPHFRSVTSGAGGYPLTAYHAEAATPETFVHPYNPVDYSQEGRFLDNPITSWVFETGKDNPFLVAGALAAAGFAGYALAGAGAAGAGAAGAEGAGLAGSLGAGGGAGMTAGEMAALGGGSVGAAGVADSVLALDLSTWGSEIGTAGGTSLMGGGAGGAGVASSWIPGISNEMVIAGGVNLAGSIYSSSVAKSAAEDQAKAYLESSGMSQDAAAKASADWLAAIDKAVQNNQITTTQALEYLGKYVDIGTDLLAPWVTSGTEMEKEYGRRVMAGPGDFQTSPGYEFTKQQGIEGVKSAMGPRYGVVSGPTMKAVADYSTGLANQEYDSFLNRYYASLGPFQTGSMAGLSAATATANLGSQYGANAANLTTSQGANLSNLYTQGAQVAGNYGMAGAGAGGSGIENAAAARASGYVDSTQMLTGSMSNLANQYMTMKMWENMGLFDRRT